MSHINSSVLKSQGTKMRTQTNVNKSQGLYSRGTAAMKNRQGGMQGRTTQNRPGQTTKSTGGKDED